MPFLSLALFGARFLSACVCVPISMHSCMPTFIPAVFVCCVLCFVLCVSSQQVAKALSTVHRTLIDALRTTIVWTVNLIIYYGITEAYGESWSKWSVVCVEVGGRRWNILDVSVWAFVVGFPKNFFAFPSSASLRSRYLCLVSSLLSIGRISRSRVSSSSSSVLFSTTSSSLPHRARPLRRLKSSRPPQLRSPRPNKSHKCKNV
jgi:hypothetical protein